MMLKLQNSKAVKTKILIPLLTAALIALTSLFISLEEKHDFLTAGFVHVDDTPYYPIRVAVVAGHGDIINREYQTYGKQSPEWHDGLKIYEGQSTHDLALRLVLKFREAGIDAEFINPELSDISLSERAWRCNNTYLKDPRTVCIFIHHNAQATDPEAAIHPPDYCDDEGLFGWTSTNTGGAHGLEVFTSRGQTRSDVLAEFTIKELKITFPDWRMRIDFTDQDNDKEANFYVLRNTYGPAILIEIGFMTTYTDCLKIADYETREQCLDAIVCGFMNYANQL